MSRGRGEGRVIYVEDRVCVKILGLVGVCYDWGRLVGFLVGEWKVRGRIV